jgi:hypothetical protein
MTGNLAITIIGDATAFVRGCEAVNAVIREAFGKFGLLSRLGHAGIASEVQAAIRYARS